ncbi:MAG: hypothetical protein HYZ50_13800 [Deltaproteobacteria bacterium]|nr:hypothetical protein [Deltaproteobacteria bacterium]
MSKRNFMTTCAIFPRLRHGRTLLMALGFIFASVVPASAKDLCIDGFFSSPIVGRGFRIPPSNQCKPFNGFTTDGSYFVAGAGCTTSAAGGFLRLSFTAHATTGGTQNPYTIFCGLPLPSLIGGTCLYTYAYAPSIGDEIAEATTPVSARTCTANVP